MAVRCLCIVCSQGAVPSHLARAEHVLVHCLHIVPLKKLSKSCLHTHTHTNVGAPTPPLSKRLWKHASAPSRLSIKVECAVQDEVMKIMPVQKQTRAGQRTRFKAFVVVGDHNGHVGLGVKCAKEVGSEALPATCCVAAALQLAGYH